jgi:hypothetical protein
LRAPRRNWRTLACGFRMMRQLTADELGAGLRRAAVTSLACCFAGESSKFAQGWKKVRKVICVDFTEAGSWLLGLRAVLRTEAPIRRPAVHSRAPEDLRARAKQALKGPQVLALQLEAAVEVALALRVLPGARAQVPVAPPPARAAVPSGALPAAPREMMLEVRAVERAPAVTTQVRVIRASMRGEDCLR